MKKIFYLFTSFSFILLFFESIRHSKLFWYLGLVTEKIHVLSYPINPLTRLVMHAFVISAAGMYIILFKRPKIASWMSFIANIIFLLLVLDGGILLYLTNGLIITHSQISIFLTVILSISLGLQFEDIKLKKDFDEMS
ncbi:hypothetical protein QWY85_00680 [Neolewinella lacunae]|uniref:Uncharacterized protein n=1 Tax=Neolewinella lacunae TaxID=1517758 RepID=A0A923PL93_9BACT|nr:hypothetical protein [Neolewinella lacunae]MBC6992557.1 hypothetical protein [Neolewinella lacunae]MDN3633148.1 hypothetical protein [Neolewinella lacunae]